MIYEKLLEFICEYSPQTETEIIAFEENIRSFEEEPQYIQRRFILNLFDEIFELEPEEYRAKKTLLLAFVFGKNEAVRIMNEDAMLKGKPPIKFLELTFGVGVAQELIKYTQKHLKIDNIGHMDDYEQINFVMQIITEIIGDEMEEWVPQLRMSFARYLKYGPEAKKILEEIGAQQDTKQMQRFVTSIKKLQYKYSDADVNKIITTSKTKSERAQKEFETQKRIQRNLEEKSPQVRLVKAEKEIANIMGRYVGEDIAQNMIVDIKKELNVKNIIGASEDIRESIMNKLLSTETLQSFSPQRNAILRSYFKTWLNLA